ncbi:transporter [Polaribacter vadi]|uniref:transporter n=1 Tax=Polaribacter TaxID=52959 RepID=UPI001C08E76B|nr:MULTISPECIES: transporter [Polaribacter]MBU3010877.1 transporter [Polaribacter vadi]MDO6740689.1 transporter [Polaribacter sp. 1_MG-2023]
MKNHYLKILVALVLIINVNALAQEKEDTKSNIQTYTPSKLLDKGQWDVKFFNNLYTETKATNNGVKTDKARETYFTSTVDIFTGISDNNRLNIGLLLEYRSNTINDKSATSVFSFADDNSSRNGLSSFAPALKWQPIQSIGNFSIQSAFHIPLIENETDANGVYLDQTAYTFQNRFFYDYTLPSGNWQLFTELNTEYNFGDDASFADKTFVLAPGLFMSYFPSDKSTILGFVQHYQRFGDFTQDFSSVGFGGKYQLTNTLNLEVLYSKFVRGTDTGLGQSFNIGLRVLF